MRQCEGWSVADALYFWLMTVSTVGYGDLAPTTPAGKTFVAIYAPVGIVLEGGKLLDLLSAWRRCLRIGLGKI